MGVFISSYEEKLAQGRTDFGYFGYEGKNVTITVRSTLETNDIPWADCKEVLAKCFKEYSRYLIFEILPHVNACSITGSLSEPYRFTIHKHDILSGKFKVEPMSI